MDTMQDKDQGFYNTEIHEGVVNLESITFVWQKQIAFWIKIYYSETINLLI